MSEVNEADEREGVSAVVDPEAFFEEVIVLVVDGKTTDRGGVDCKSREDIECPNSGPTLGVTDVVYEGLWGPKGAKDDEEVVKV